MSLDQPAPGAPGRALVPPATAATAAVTAALSGWWLLISQDRLRDLGASLGALPWPVAALVVALLTLTCLHFVFAALALRAASGQSMPLLATTCVQLSAAATNRVVPNGVGGAAVNARYLRRCGVNAGAAVGALGMLAALGALTDAGYAAAVTAVGPLVGIAGATREFRLLAGHGLRVGQQLSWVTLAGVTAVGVVILVRRRLPGRTAVARGLGEAIAHLRQLGRQPRRVLSAAAASVATTAVVSAGFVLTADVLGHPRTTVPAGALVAIYLLAAAIGGAAPLPAFAVVTESALLAGLTFAGFTFSSALAVVLVFRVATYWAPLPLGVLAGRRLRTRGLL
jgi:uncharacterized membrane protein YbhN (UPF0104 family)